ncbi:MAG: hypothetical protein A2076_04155 [Geobacteraceae bacterium GWC2_53_11]|nr:MAG: hypothetical protein A2076_04155 [Geobacteraceae bacterium GWC2_53_11]
MRILVVEDDQYKHDILLNFLQKKLNNSTIISAKSVSSSIKAINDELFDYIILDMSLPTFDVSSTESGGKPQGFGGVDILRYLDSLDYLGAVIVVTQFEKFGDGVEEKDLTLLRSQLLDEFPQILKAVVYFDSTVKTWQNELSKVIDLI